jgi:hypothetical protein
MIRTENSIEKLMRSHEEDQREIEATLRREKERQHILL